MPDTDTPASKTERAAVRLEWDGKRSPAAAAPAALRTNERYRSAGSDPAAAADRLIQADNLAAMAALRGTLGGRFALIYLDPPFFSGRDRMAASAGAEEEAEGYRDTWNGSAAEYLQWLYDRLAAAWELVSPNGSLYLHLDWRVAHNARALLDEICGPERFQNEIAWCYREAINSRKRWNRKHDTILFYTKGAGFTFNCDAVLEPYSESGIRKYRLRDDRGPYRLMGRGIESSPLRSKRDLPAHFETEYPDLTFRHYLGAGSLPVDYWRIDIENQASAVRTGYPTQKPEELLRRILLASTNPGDLVGDFCCGSGTTPAVAQALGRRWVACDAGALAIATTRRRLLGSPGCNFTVESGGEPVPAWTDGPPAAQCVRPVRALFGCGFELTEQARPMVDAWAVARHVSDPDAPFSPFWWSVRSRKTGEASPQSPVEPGADSDAEPADALGEIRLFDRAGRQLRISARQPEGRSEVEFEAF